MWTNVTCGVYDEALLHSSNILMTRMTDCWIISTSLFPGLLLFFFRVTIPSLPVLHLFSGDSITTSSESLSPLSKMKLVSSLGVSRLARDLCWDCFDCCGCEWYRDFSTVYLRLFFPISSTPYRYLFGRNDNKWYWFIRYRQEFCSLQFTDIVIHECFEWMLSILPHPSMNGLLEVKEAANNDRFGEYSIQCLVHRMFEVNRDEGFMLGARKVWT